MIGMAMAAMLLQATPVTPPTEVAKPTMKCRRQVDTGTLARVQKICHTAEEWRRLYGNGRETTADMQRPGVSPPAVN
ncbi:hypothetical protein [Sphingomonas sp. R86521]|uniref:hypothetical protein n=1 Tax=Sphingomonas sp. R86521 TaxID=3093860 RepID=UPI0036D29539